ncbi:MAG TPA: glycosyltransferase family 4 protein [Steroidobacteraceae bacterium]|jgi:glycosyltransferase involved in cell wall biosynthesis|nr:glycosyltransferase family 4 protein [Steroidobacteraceae bacterium]
MKIAQIAPLYESVPPKLYGGTERVVAYLCNALVELGHDVTLFAAGDSRTKARLVRVRDEAIRLDSAALKSDVAAHLSMLHEVKRRASHFDILHFHVEMMHFAMFELYAHNSVTTVHGRLDIKDLPLAYERWRSFGLVSISDYQRRPLAGAKWLATVPHGVPAALYELNERPAGGYLAFLGRISPEKGPEVAIRLAKRAGIPLRIAAKVDSTDREYFQSVVEPLLDHPLIEFIGEIGDAQKSDFLGNARALLFPVRWPEPFGLVMIEAMACGTPVVAFDCGSVTEVVQHGVNGYIVNSEEQALRAIADAHHLDRRAVRATFGRHFTVETMARAYIDVYSNLIESHRLGRAS